MLGKFITLVLGLIIIGNAEAACVLARGTPTVLHIPSKIIRIQADAPSNTTSPIATYNTPTTGSTIGYDDCLDGSEYGKRAMNLFEQDIGTEIYATKIPGIGIKLYYNNGSALGGFPQTDFMHSKHGEKTSTFDYLAGASYRIEFYKTSENIHLENNNPNGDIVLNAGDIGYSYVLNANPSNFTLKLNIGEMRIVSTPSCDIDQTKTIDFGDIAPNQLTASGIERDVDFKMTCRTDYGHYSATASINTETPSSDATYIKVKDAGGNNDILGIKISDSNHNAMRIDGNTKEVKNSVSSNTPAQFNWKATLVPITEALRPTVGTFSAQAEIILQIK